MNITQNDAPFKPSNPPKEVFNLFKGYNCSLGKFPKYMENPLKELKKIVDKGEKKEIYK